MEISDRKTFEDALYNTNAETTETPMFSGRQVKVTLVKIDAVSCYMRIINKRGVFFYTA